ncbi:MAG: dipeptidase [Candidatus Acidiferrum sp.]
MRLTGPSKIFFAVGMCLLAGMVLAGTMAADGIAERAKRLHFSSLVIDTHADTTQRFLDNSFDLGARNALGSIDIPRMKEGGLGAIFFSIWIPSKVTGPDAVKRALDQIDAVREEVRKHADDLALATTAEGIRAAHEHGKIAALIGVEGGHMIASDLSVLRTYAELGARYMTLTHTGNVEWADASTDKPVHNGLTDFGKEVVREMNRLGMIVDVSHVSDKTFADVLEVSKAPVFASHSDCRALCDAPRNMTDDMIRALAAKGGVIQINYHVGFLSQEFRNTEKAHPEWDKAISLEIQRRCGAREGCRLIEGDRITREYVTRGDLPKVEWTKIIEHINHAVKIAGIEHVGLGSDFDGANMPFGMEDASKLPRITQALLEEGYSEGDVKKILGENTLRLMAEAERVGRELNATH